MPYQFLLIVASILYFLGLIPIVENTLMRLGFLHLELRRKTTHLFFLIGGLLSILLFENWYMAFLSFVSLGIVGNLAFSSRLREWISLSRLPLTN